MVAANQLSEQVATRVAVQRERGPARVDLPSRKTDRRLEMLLLDGGESDSSDEVAVQSILVLP